jgi:hypothetical protein
LQVIKLLHDKLGALENSIRSVPLSRQALAAAVVSESLRPDEKVLLDEGSDDSDAVDIFL